MGTVLVGLVYAPLLSFYIKDSATRTRGWITTLALCGLVYGGTDFSVLRGVTDAFAKRRRAWVPTNGVVAHAVDAGLFAEAAFGLALLIVPLVYLPELLYLPCWFLFAGKFLFGPALSTLYRDVPYDAVETVHAGHGHTVGVELLDTGNVEAAPKHRRMASAWPIANSPWTARCSLFGGCITARGAREPDRTSIIRFPSSMTLRTTSS